MLSAFRCVPGRKIPKYESLLSECSAFLIVEVSAWSTGNAADCQQKFRPK